MKLRVMCWIPVAAAALLALPAGAQEANSTPSATSHLSDGVNLTLPSRVPMTKKPYQQPLAEGAQVAPASRTPGAEPSSLPVLPVAASPLERTSRNALNVAAKAAVVVAADKTGTTTSMPASSYPAFRPGQPTPEPSAGKVSCQPSRTVACAEH
ncbi:hypothetical protein [Dyella sp. 20L07]|uniref:hypothetical protein n=1 Tax=Dyella sp. 20L07 TaxID=3384240 RepID=UPI003D2E1FE5